MSITAAGNLRAGTPSRADQDAQNLLNADVLIDLETLRRDGIGRRTSYYADTSQSPVASPVTITASEGANQLIGLTSTLALTVQLPVNADMTPMDSYIIYDSSHNSETYNITITMLSGSARIYGLGLPSAGVTTLTIANNRGGYAELLYIAPNIWELVSCNLNTGYLEKTATYTSTIFDRTINCTSGTFTVSLLTAIGCQGLRQTIKNSGVGVITVDAFSSQTIDGATTQVLNADDSITIESTNANWILI